MNKKEINSPLDNGQLRHLVLRSRMRGAAVVPRTLRLEGFLTHSKSALYLVGYLT